MPKTDPMVGRKFSVNFPSPQPTSRTLSVGCGDRYCKSFWVSLGTKEADAEYACKLALLVLGSFHAGERDFKFHASADHWSLLAIFLSIKLR